MYKTERKWLSEYRGIIAILIQSQIPFSVLTSPIFTSEDLEGYDVLMLPYTESLSKSQSNVITKFIKRGGQVIATGHTPGTKNEFGDRVKSRKDRGGLLPLKKTTSDTTQRGKGEIVLETDRIGYKYLKFQSSESRKFIEKTLSKQIA
eukprot:Awhi_evm1s1528